MRPKLCLGVIYNPVSKAQNLSSAERKPRLREANHMRSLISSHRPVHLLLATLLLSGAVAHAETPSPSVIELELGATARITSDGTPALLAIRDLEEITGRSRDKCILAIGDDATMRDPRDESLVEISGSGELGFAKNRNWIGLRPQNRGIDCGRLQEREWITLGLGSSIPENKLIESATFSLRLKGSVHIDIEATTAGGNADSYQVRSGTAVVENVGSSTGDGGVFNCPIRPDSAPDDEASCKFTIDQGFYGAFTLTTRSGEWSLGNGTTSFRLGEALNCGESLTTDFPGGDGVVTLTRLDNAEEAETCSPIPATLRWNAQQGANEFEFLADYSDQSSATFFWEVEWPEEAPNGAERPAPMEEPFTDESFPDEFKRTFTSQIRPTLQRFRDDDEQFFIDMCRGTTTRDEEGNFLAHEGDFPDLSSAPGTQYACWLTRSIEHRDGNKIRVTETGYLQGDWVATRTLQ